MDGIYSVTGVGGGGSSCRSKSRGSSSRVIN